MENKSETLGKKLDKPDWKQWLPVYGMYQAAKDALNYKPNIITEITEEGVRKTQPSLFYGSAAYHAIATIGTVYGLYQLAEKLF